MDGHALRGAKPETLEKLQNEPEDEFGVKHLNMIYSEEEDKMYCILNAPNKEAIKKHHDKLGYKCDFIMEIDTTTDNFD